MQIYSSIIGFLEWIALLSFPIALLGYKYKYYFIQIIFTSLIISALSYFFKLFSFNLSLSIGLQMLLLNILIYYLFKVKRITALFITSVGYGFYTAVFLLIIEITLSSLGSDFETVFYSPIIVGLQFTSFLVIGVTSWLLYKFKYHFSDLAKQLNTNIKKTYAQIIYVNSFFTLCFILIASYAMSFFDLSSRYLYVMLSISVIFVILCIYLILHSHFQSQRLIELKKFYLDQENQISSVAGRLQSSYKDHLQLIYKLQEKNILNTDGEFSKKYLIPKKVEGKINIDPKLIDELFYALLINKRNLAQLLGVSLNISTDVTENNQIISLKEVQHLSILIDELILTLFDAKIQTPKNLNFHYEVSFHHLFIDLSSDSPLKFELHKNLKVQDSLLYFRRNHATLALNDNPLQLSIDYNLNKKGVVL